MSLKNPKKGKSRIMHLFIHTCDDETMALAFFSKSMEYKKKIVVKKIFHKNNVLDSIEKFLKKEKIKPANLEGILCVKGPGKFSSVRMGVAVANTLSWFLNIPIAEIVKDEIPKEEKMFWNFLKKKIQSQKMQHIIEPLYGGEPNITIKK